MKRIFALLALALVLAAGQNLIAQSRVGTSGEKARAERAWPSFFKAFQAAVNKRDRVELRKMMVPDFFFSGGGGDDNHNGDMRDEAFKFLDDPHVHGWRAFDKALARGAVSVAPSPDGEGKKHYARVAPPAARNTTNLATAPPWIAYFEFRDGVWYCTSFSECCD